MSTSPVDGEDGFAVLLGPVVRTFCAGVGGGSLVTPRFPASSATDPGF